MTNQEPQPKQPRIDTNGREGKARKTNRRWTQIQWAWPWLVGRHIEQVPVPSARCIANRRQRTRISPAPVCVHEHPVTFRALVTTPYLRASASICGRI